MSFNSFPTGVIRAAALTSMRFVNGGQMIRFGVLFHVGWRFPVSNRLRLNRPRSSVT